MNSTSTHDTKRSEDVRARINVLSEIPEEWSRRALHWAELNRDKKSLAHDEPAPESNDEYLLYQTLVGAWPLAEVDDDDREQLVERVQQYMEKATREAKVHTSWINPDEEYDQALREFVAAVLDPAVSGEFLEDLIAFQSRVARMGMLNALSATTVKLTCPGTPDVYQGQEVWDFSLVDPDNRRPVDYAVRSRALDGLISALQSGERREVAREVLDGWQDGRAKLLLTHLLLRYRRDHPDLFREGVYVPLQAAGERAEHVIAFARQHEEQSIIVVAPRFWATLLWDEDARVPEGALWSGTDLKLSSDTGGTYRNLLTGETLGSGRAGSLPLDRVLESFPVAVLERV